jgi:uncharacterized protein YndB with AHSA1/START domain
MAAEPIHESVTVDATPTEVYEFFIDSQAMTEWMGQHAVLNPIPGGDFAVDVGGSQIRGSYLELDPPHRLVISWGFIGSEELPPGRSIVEVLLSACGDGTRVEITHRGLPGGEAEKHAPGWAHFLKQLVASVPTHIGSRGEL